MSCSAVSVSAVLFCARPDGEGRLAHFASALLDFLLDPALSGSAAVCSAAVRGARMDPRMPPTRVSQAFSGAAPGDRGYIPDTKVTKVQQF